MLYHMTYKVHCTHNQVYFKIRKQLKLEKVAILFLYLELMTNQIQSCMIVLLLYRELKHFPC